MKSGGMSPVATTSSSKRKHKRTESQVMRDVAVAQTGPKKDIDDDDESDTEGDDDDSDTSETDTETEDEDS